MGRWPVVRMPAPKIISPYSPESIAGMHASLEFSTGPTSNVVVQNQAYFFPFELQQSATAVKMCVLNGATVNGNTDVGIYDSEFNRIVSMGATAQAGTSAIQEFDITDTALIPDNYWMAISSSSATATFFRYNAADEIVVPQIPMYVMGSAHPLPATATAIKPTDTSPAYGIAMAVSFDTLI